jgi:hypothetical protein
LLSQTNISKQQGEIIDLKELIMRVTVLASTLSLSLVLFSCGLMASELKSETALSLDPEFLLNQWSVNASLWEYFSNNSPEENHWMTERLRMLDSLNYPQDASTIPCIMMAGYMDTDISWADGGKFTMLAYVLDMDSDIDYVEMYWEGEPTGVYLYDDGAHGDFGVDDSLWGISFDIDPLTFPEGQYLIELRARDVDGNFSDIWPYLTVHP